MTSMEIKEDMPVVCSNNGQFATVDHVDAGDTIKLTKDASGQHHWIPRSWETPLHRTGRRSSVTTSWNTTASVCGCPQPDTLGQEPRRSSVSHGR